VGIIWEKERIPEEWKLSITFNEIFSGRQPCQDVKVFQHFGN
jgi:hypothetical protein